MKSRQEIKAIAKQNFKEFYWPCVGTTFLMGMLAALLTGSFLFGGLVVIGFSLFSTQVYRGMKTSMKLDLTGRKIGGYLWMGLFAFFWSLLFIIPGIVKSFSYAMTPYILGDCPDVKATDALKLSMRMMKGHKWELFVFMLSFLGWDILSVITFGLVGIFYSDPYKGISYGGYYDELKQEAIRSGVVTEEQFNGTVAA